MATMNLKVVRWLVKAKRAPELLSVLVLHVHMLLQSKNAFGSPALDPFLYLHYVFFLLILLSLSDVGSKIFSAKRASFISVKCHANLGWYVNI